MTNVHDRLQPRITRKEPDNHATVCVHVFFNKRIKAPEHPVEGWYSLKYEKAVNVGKIVDFTPALVIVSCIVQATTTTPT